MPKTTRSRVKNGQVYYKNTGRYNEVTKSAMGKFINDAPSSLKQKSLASATKKNVSSLIVKNVLLELGW